MELHTFHCARIKKSCPLENWFSQKIKRNLKFYYVSKLLFFSEDDILANRQHSVLSAGEVQETNETENHCGDAGAM